MMWATNARKVRSLIAVALKQYEHLPRYEQDHRFAEVFDKAHKDGLLATPAELVGGKWVLTVSPDVRTIAIDMKFADAESEEYVHKLINKG